jgi:hypothetical protein
MTLPIVIISTGRTGTIFFARLIGELYPEVAAYHERGFSRPIQIFTNAYFARLFPKQGLILAWKAFKGREVLTCKKPFHLDANCFLYGLAAVEPRLIPELKVIHIVRDPRTYVTSHLNFAKYKATSFIANYLVPFWQPSPFLTRKIPWKQFSSFSRLERYSWIWDFKNNIMESIERTEIPYLRVRFEDIFYSESPEENFNLITDFIGLPRRTGIRERFFQPINKAPKNNFPEWTDWAASQCAQLHALCGKRMESYGYGNEAAWRIKIGTKGK